MKYLFYITVCLSVVTSLYFISKCDEKCTELKRQKIEWQIEKETQFREIQAKQQEHNRQIEVERAKNEITVRKDTDQVIKDRLLEKGTDIGVNIGLNLIGELLK